MADTTKNLEAAFAGESQANRKYLAFAKKADEERQKGIARLFRQQLLLRPCTRTTISTCSRESAPPLTISRQPRWRAP